MVKELLFFLLLSLVVSFPVYGENGSKEQVQEWLSEIRVGILAHDFAVFGNKENPGGDIFSPGDTHAPDIHQLGFGAFPEEFEQAAALGIDFMDHFPGDKLGIIVLIQENIL